MLLTSEETDEIVKRINKILSEKSKAEVGSLVWIATYAGGHFDITSPAPGVFLSSLNMNILIAALCRTVGYEFVDTSFDDEKAALDRGENPFGEGWRCPYIVCDNVEQALEYYTKWSNMPDRSYGICMTEIRREPGSRGGWRWHKWGPYIGAKTPTTEYLDDEPEIEAVFVAHIYELRETPKETQ